MTRRKLIYGAGAVVSAVLAVGSFGLARGETDGMSAVTRPISRGDITAVVIATGTLEATTTVEVGSQVSGTVESLSADFNSLVRKGEVVARLEPSLFDTQVQQARANLVKAQSDLDRLQVAAADASSKLQRARELSEKRLIASADLDGADVAKRTADAQVRSAEASVIQARAALSQAEVTLSKTVITAPIDGIVIARNVDVGQTVAASVQAPTLFVIAADLSKMQVNVSIDESDVGVVKAGQQVSFRVGAYPDETFRGVVEQLRLNPTVDQNVVTYTAVIAAPNTSLKLKPGMTATVTIEIDKRLDVLRVPNAALQYRPAGESKGRGSEVWVESGGTPSRVALITGLNDGTYTEVISGNLIEGANVITGSRSTLDQMADLTGLENKTRPAAAGNPFAASAGRGVGR